MVCMDKPGEPSPVSCTPSQRPDRFSPGIEKEDMLMKMKIQESLKHYKLDLGVKHVFQSQLNSQCLILHTNNLDFSH